MKVWGVCRQGTGLRVEQGRIREHPQREMSGKGCWWFSQNEFRRTRFTYVEGGCAYVYTCVYVCVVDRKG